MPMPMLFFPPTSDLMAAAAAAGGGEGGGDSMGAMDGILLGTAAMLPRPSAIEKQQQQIPQFLQQQLFAMEQQLQHNNNNNPNSHHQQLLPLPPPPLPLPLPCSFPSSVLPMPVSSSSSFIPIFNQLIEPPPPPLSFSLINENQQKLANSIENGFVDSMATALNPPSFQTPLQNANASAGTNFFPNSQPILLPMSSSSCEQSRLPPPSSPSQQSQMGLLNLNDGNGHGNGNGNGPSSLPLSSLVNSTLAGPLLAQLGDGGAIEVPSQMAMPPTGPCGFCGMEILDKNFLLIDAQSWHLNCVRCSACGQNLEELGPTCFAKDGLLYCRRDYLIKFGKRCERCSIPIERGEMVMRVPRGGPTSPIPDDMAFFHVHCFTCICCGQLLSSGEQFTVGQFHQFGLAGGGPLFCKVHFHWNLPSCQSASSMAVQPSQIHLLTCPPPYEGGGNTEEPRSLTELNPSASLQIQKEQPPQPPQSQQSQQSQQPPQPITTTLSSQGCHHPSPMPRAFSRSGFDGDKENPPPPNMITTTTTTTAAVMADQQRIVGRQESLTPTNGANPSPDDYNYSNGDPYGGSSSSQKQKRMRTSFKHHQV